MVEVNNFSSTKALDNNFGKLESKEKFDGKDQACNMAVDAWKEMEKCSPKFNNLKLDNDKVLTFDDIYKSKELSKIPADGGMKKEMSKDDIVRNKKEKALLLDKADLEIKI